MKQTNKTREFLNDRQKRSSINSSSSGTFNQRRINLWIFIPDKIRSELFLHLFRDRRPPRA